MPRPRNDREAWQDELRDLPALLEQFRRELQETLAATAEDKDRREALLWKIRRAEHRITDLRARLSSTEGEHHG